MITALTVKRNAQNNAARILSPLFKSITKIDMNRIAAAIWINLFQNLIFCFLFIIQSPFKIEVSVSVG